MTFDELTKTARKMKPVLILEDIITHQKRVILRTVLSWICFACLVFIAVVSFRILPSLDAVSPYLLKIRGLFFVSLGLDIGLCMLEAFFYSSYSHSLEGSGVSFDLARLLFTGSPEDAAYCFLASTYGWDTADRLEISPADSKDFLGNQTELLPVKQLVFQKDQVSERIDLGSYTAALFDGDKEFADFLFARSIQKEQLVSAALWVETIVQEKIIKERWWQKEALARVPGMAKNWSYGQTYVLDRYGYDLTEEMSFKKASGRLSFVRDEVSKLEAILSRNREANAFIIGDDEDQRLAVVEALAKRIHDGSILPVLEHKRVYLINGNSLVEHNSDKASFETEFAELLSQAIQSGNAIIVLSQFPALLLSARSFGSDISALMDPFLRSANIQIVGLCDTANFHQYVESNTDLFQHFEAIQITEKDNGHLMNLLEDEAFELERQTGAFFTYQALETIIEGTERYFAGLPVADKTRDLLSELIPFIIQKKSWAITRADVLALIESKTGIPTGEVKEAEKDKLLHLEAILHQKIIGQDEAIVAISQALRRSRSDLRNHNKPIGSFLFLGPTGVGKTETSKALAEVFFGMSAPVVRLDMSEYTGSDALPKLIGSFKESRGGILSNALREHPYGILLLDEFEKSETEVLNLFLQILDEGYFSDMQGRKVNARNMIIIATSNAGSGMIFDLVKQGKDLKDSKDMIIQTLIAQNIFKPELLNRFDGVIVFHPLDGIQLVHVADMLVSKKVEEFKKKGYEMIVTPDLIQFLIVRGTDQTFGARPMNRAISEEVEAVVAEEILKGSLPKGSRFELISDGLPNGRLMVKIVA
jgi:ATP-dependent Clp protease ATP-binding subunit ClpA